MNGAETTMTVTLKIEDDTGKSVTEADKVALTNLPLHSIFSQVSVSLNGIEPNPEVGALYPYKMYLELLTKETSEMKATIGQERGYYPDGTGTVGTTDPKAEVNANAGLISRYNLTKTGATITLHGPIGIDFLELCNRYLINGVPITMTFFQSPDAFRLLADADAKKYRVAIQNMYIEAKMVKGRGEMLISHSKLLAENKTAMYAYPRSSLRSYMIPAGSTQFDVAQVLSDRVPALLIAGLIESEAVSGKYSKNPFQFQHFNLSEIGLYSNSMSIPGRPFTPDFAKSSFASEYSALQAMSNGQGNGLSKADFKDGNAVFCFHVQNHVNLNQGVYPIIRKANTRLELKFETALANAVVLLIYSITPGFYRITEARNVIVEY